jgi:hypothetical protein
LLVAFVRVAMFNFASSRVVVRGLGNGILELVEVGLLIAFVSLMPCAVGSCCVLYSNAVDIFNVTSGAWSTAALTVNRSNLGATSLPNLGVAIFAGGESKCCHVDFLAHSLLCFSRLGMGCLSGRKLAC